MYNVIVNFLKKLCTFKVLHEKMIFCMRQVTVACSKRGRIVELEAHSPG